MLKTLLNIAWSLVGLALLALQYDHGAQASLWFSYKGLLIVGVLLFVMLVTNLLWFVHEVLEDAGEDALERYYRDSQ